MIAEAKQKKRYLPRGRYLADEEAGEARQLARVLVEERGYSVERLAEICGYANPYSLIYVIEGRNRAAGRVLEALRKEASRWRPLGRARAPWWERLAAWLGVR